MNTDNGLLGVIDELKQQLAIMRQERDDLLQARAICPECAKKIDEAAGIDLVGLNRQLAASQAREQQLREFVSTARYLYQYSQKIGTPEQAGRYSREHEEHHDEAGILLSLPQDDTALRQWGAKLLRGMADHAEAHIDYPTDQEDIDLNSNLTFHAKHLRRKADELEEG